MRKDKPEERQKEIEALRDFLPWQEKTTADHLNELVNRVEHWIYMDCVEPPASIEDRIEAREFVRSYVEQLRHGG